MKYPRVQVSSAEGLDPDQKKVISQPAFERKTMPSRTLMLLVAIIEATRIDIVRIQVDGYPPAREG